MANDTVTVANLGSGSLGSLASFSRSPLSLPDSSEVTHDGCAPRDFADGPAGMASKRGDTCTILIRVACMRQRGFGLGPKPAAPLASDSDTDFIFCLSFL